MREIRTSGSEGGARFNPLSLPLSERNDEVVADVSPRRMAWRRG